MKSFPAVAGLAALVLATPLPAQMPAQTYAPRLFLEARAGAVVPTFGIADVAKTGSALGGTLGYRIGSRWILMGEFDYGMHKDKATGAVEIRTLHYLAKVGYALTPARERGWEAAINLGAGAVSFDVEGAAETNTYFAINAGAKIAYNFSRSFAVVLSPQGDIAFSKKAELTTSNAWVWPVTAGLRIRFSPPTPEHLHETARRPRRHPARHRRPQLGPGGLRQLRPRRRPHRRRRIRQQERHRRRHLRPRGSGRGLPGPGVEGGAAPLESRGLTSARARPRGSAPVPGRLACPMPPGVVSAVPVP